MFCNQCGQTNSNDARFCSGCGSRLETQNIQTIHIPPQLEKTEPLQPSKRKVGLWNPNAAANWSLLFTPIFGSYLQMKNWQALGKPEDANTAKNWISFTIIFILFINFATPFIWDDVEKVTTISRGLGFWYIIIWYFAYARKQPKYVKENLNDKYQKKSWLIPLSSATVILFISFTVLMVVSSSIIQSIQNQKPSQRKDDVDWDNGEITPEKEENPFEKYAQQPSEKEINDSNEISNYSKEQIDYMMSRSAEWNNANNMNKKESDTKLNIVQKHSEYNAVGQIFTTHHIIYDKISEIEKQDFLLRDKKCTLTVKALLSQGVSFSKIYYTPDNKEYFRDYIHKGSCP
mgnify:FL=1